MSAIQERADPARAAAPPRNNKRLDIQGLRAVAVLAVVLDHVGTFHIPGGFVGVDIFFVISGFLITSHLVRGATTEGRVGFAEFYANRVRRLVPAATATLVFCIVITRWVLPSTRWADFAAEIMGSSLYVENWVLAGNSVDYMTQDSLPSPVQHFWSLAVEEQFYIVWPIMIMLVLALFGASRRFTRSHARSQRSFIAARPEGLRIALIVGLAAIAIPSLAWSILYTSSDPSPAYFVTTTRLWELAIGGFVAVGGDWQRRMPRAAGGMVAWAGVATIAVSLVVINSSTPFPGYAALLPTLGTAAVISGGMSAGRRGPLVLLGMAPARILGDASYSVYLWHWPLVIIARSRLDHIAFSTGVLLVLVSVAVGYLSYRWIETPTRWAPWWAEDNGRALGLGVGLACTVTLLSALTISHAASALETRALVAQAKAQASFEHTSPDGPQVKLGAEVLPASALGARAGEPRDSFTTLVPDPSAALSDRVDCQTSPIGDSRVSKCPFLSEAPRADVALVGDSHAAQWLPALEPLAEDRDWNLTAYIHDACPFARGAIVRDGKAYEDCIQWNRALTATLLNARGLDVIITSNFTDSAAVAGGPEAMSAAFRAAWKPFLDRGVTVVVIRDNPFPKTVNVAECAAVHQKELKKCSFPRGPATSNQGVAQMLAARGLPGAISLDLTDAICPTDPCAAAIGQVLVYRDTNHLTGTYVRSLEPRIRAALVGKVRGL